MNIQTWRMGDVKPPLVLKVLVYDLASDKQIREHTIKLCREGKREWLVNLCVWAACNGKGVEILAIQDDRQFNNREM